MKFNWKRFLEILASFIVGLIGCFVFTSCGVTKAYIKQPREGSSTTITITTNNPISTNVDPNTSAEFLNK